MKVLEMARLGSRFDRAHSPGDRATRAARCPPHPESPRPGDYSVEVDGAPPTITLRIAGDALLECHIYDEPKDVQAN